MRPDFRPSMTAAVSMSAPRPVLTSMTPGLHAGDRVGVDQVMGLGVSGQLRVMMSLARHSSSSATYLTPRSTRLSFGTGS